MIHKANIKGKEITIEEVVNDSVLVSQKYMIVLKGVIGPRTNPKEVDIEKYGNIYVLCKI